MKKEKWSLWKTAQVFALLVMISFIVRYWDTYYSIFSVYGTLSSNQIAIIVGGFLGSMMGDAGLGCLVAIIKNRVFVKFLRGNCYAYP